jgi:hypothetical protein
MHSALGAIVFLRFSVSRLESSSAVVILMMLGKKVLSAVYKAFGVPTGIIIPVWQSCF